MKTIRTIAILIIGSAIIFSCKKKDETLAPAPTPAPITLPTHVNKMTAKVNGTSWSMASTQGLDYTMISGSSGLHMFGSSNSFSDPSTVLSLNFKDSVGTFVLQKFGIFNARYRDENNVYYSSLTGTLNITTIDTVGAGSFIIKKFKSTFSFSTDTIGGKSFQVTEGVIDYEQK